MTQTPPPNSDHYRKLEAMYFSAPFNRDYATQLTITQGRAEVIMPVKPERFHVLGATHGAVYFKAMDDVAFFAANSLVEDAFLLTVSFNLYFMRPISEGHMRAVGTIMSASKRQWIAEAVVYNAHDDIIARGSGMFVKSRTPLTPEIGYKLG